MNTVHAHLTQAVQAIRNGGDPNASMTDLLTAPTMEPNLPWSALHTAVQEGHLAIVQALLALGASPFPHPAQPFNLFASALWPLRPIVLEWSLRLPKTPSHEVLDPIIAIINLLGNHGLRAPDQQLSSETIKNHQGTEELQDPLLVLLEILNEPEDVSLFVDVDQLMKRYDEIFMKLGQALVRQGCSPAMALQEHQRAYERNQACRALFHKKITDRRPALQMLLDLDQLSRSLSHLNPATPAQRRM